MTEYICLKCSNIGKPKRLKRGSGKTEFVAWMCFPFGLPYTFWRMLSKMPVCKSCSEPFIEPVTSPVGMRMIENIEKDLPRDPTFEEFINTR